MKHDINLDKDTWRDWLSLDDKCIFCNKTVRNLLNEIKGTYFLPFSLNHQMIFLNDHTKCLTDEEYLIKKIIE